MFKIYLCRFSWQISRKLVQVIFLHLNAEGPKTKMKKKYYSTLYKMSENYMNAF